MKLSTIKISKEISIERNKISTIIKKISMRLLNEIKSVL